MRRKHGVVEVVRLHQESSSAPRGSKLTLRVDILGSMNKSRLPEAQGTIRPLRCGYYCDDGPKVK